MKINKKNNFLGNHTKHQEQLLSIRIFFQMFSILLLKFITSKAWPTLMFYKEKPFE